MLHRDYGIKLCRHVQEKHYYETRGGNPYFDLSLRIDL